MQSTRGGAQRLDEAEGKGTNFLHFMQSLAAMKGSGAVEATLARLPAELAEALRLNQMVSIGWYPVSSYRAMHEAMHEATNCGWDLSRAIGRDATLRSFRGIDRMVVRVLSPQTAIGQAHRLMTMYWRGGVATPIDVRSDFGRVRFSGWGGFNRCVWEAVAGSVEGLVEACGGKNGQVRVISGGRDGSREMEVEMRWEGR